MGIHFGVVGRRLELDQSYRLVYGLPGLQLNPEVVEPRKDFDILNQQTFRAPTASESGRRGGVLMPEVWPLGCFNRLALTTFQSCA
jgi:hypothetical protein